MPNRANSSKSGPRFQDYLSGLREEFDRLSNATSTKLLGPRRFDIYLGGLKCELEHMALKIKSLQKEKDEKVDEIQNVRHNIICERCGKRMLNAPQAQTPRSSQPKTTSSLFSRPFFQSKSLDKRSKPDTLSGVNVTDSTRHTAVIQKNASPVTPTPSSQSSNTIIAHSPISPLPRTSTNSGSKERSWSITFNDNVEKELNVAIVHALPHGKPIFCVSFSQDGKYLAAGCENGKAYIYDVETGTETCFLKRWLAEKDHVNSVRLNREGDDLATDSPKGDDKDRINSVCFSRDGKYLATGSSDGGIYIWQLRSKYVRNSFKKHTGFIVSFGFSPNGRLLVSTSYDNSVLLWNMRDGSSKFLVEDNPTFLDDPCYSSTVFSPDGRYVAASHRDGIVRVWDVRKGQLRRKLQAHMCRMYDVVFMPDGKGLVSGGKDMTLKFWNISSLYADTTNHLDGHVSVVEEQTRPARKFFGHKDSVRSLAISPDGKWVASGSYDRSVRIWDTQTAALQCTLDNVHKITGTVAFSPAGCYLASGGYDGMVRIWRYSYTTLAGHVHGPT